MPKCARNERIWMIIDISHARTKTFYDVIATTFKARHCSHRRCRALDVRGNADYGYVAGRCERNGGVVGINSIRIMKGFPTVAVKSRQAASERRQTRGFHKYPDGGEKGRRRTNYKSDYGAQRPVSTQLRKLSPNRTCDQNCGRDNVGRARISDGVPQSPKGT